MGSEIVERLAEAAYERARQEWGKNPKDATPPWDRAMTDTKELWCDMVRWILPDAARITALEAMCEKMAGALEGLSKAEAEYRRRHDLCGSGHTLTGRAWDVMRRAGDEARETLAQYREADNGR